MALLVASRSFTDDPERSLDGVVLTMESGGIYAIDQRERCAKLSSPPEAVVGVGWGSLNRLCAPRAIPPEALNAPDVTVLRELLDHPMVRPIDELQPGDRAYLGSADDWVVTTPITAIFIAVSVPSRSSVRRYLAVADGAAWVVDELGIYSVGADGDSGPRPRFLSPGDFIDDHFIRWLFFIERLDRMGTVSRPGR
ncbi:hypothetical protein OHB93_02245 [Microbacterium sp. No. 7]|uniref:hypothetical protein n=1 Tax=Microbacterium sp. No. 7 TaxID=1714373 RepID=UPI00300AF7FC